MGRSTDGITTREYQQEMLEESLQRNIIIALDTGSGKTHIAILRIKTEVERQPMKVSWFVAPTVTLCEQQCTVIQGAISGPVGLISGSKEPDQWKNASLWQTVLHNNRVLVTTPQVLLDALRHSYVSLGRDISLLVFDEAHHAVDNHPYNRIMKEFYFVLPPQVSSASLGYQRPSILGLTASPIYGGNVEKAFRTIEENLDSFIRTPRRHKDELTKFVHRPVFKHVLFDPPDVYNAFSTNVAALNAVIRSMDIRNDPYVHSLRRQLSRAVSGSAEYHRIDQKLSKVIQREDSFTHKGLRDFERTAEVICQDLGPWAADWYVWEVIQYAKRAANPQNNIISTWKHQEKAYLLDIIDRIGASPVSYYQDDILDECSNKVRALINTLLNEKLQTELMNESYSGLVFVQRRDTVLALAELLRNHPLTKDVFKFGCLLGTSDNPYRHSFLDITRFMHKVSQKDTLDDFKIGETTVIVSTAVAEEGIDIQACGSVIRWDVPQNMASWAQSRGRARRKRSTYTVFFQKGGLEQNNISKWLKLEQEMITLYNDPSRDYIVDEAEIDSDDDDEVLEFREPSTGALLTLHSAVSHLSHFCAVIPPSVHADNRPLYDIDPHEYPEGWHSFDNRSRPPVSPYSGPFGSTVTLPRSLPLPNRHFSTERIYRSRISAHRHAAFMAYKALYDAKLLNEYLLPITSVTEPHQQDAVKELLKDVEQRDGLANVSLQVNPWAFQDIEARCWYTHELVIDGLPPLILFNISCPILLPNDKGPTLHRPGQAPILTHLHFIESIGLSDTRIEQARQYTKMLLWSMNGSRMSWEKDDFPYLVLPKETDPHWAERRAWLSQCNADSGTSNADAYFANAETFGKAFAYPTDLSIIRNGFRSAKSYRFAGWRFHPLNDEEVTSFRKYYSRFEDLEIVYPLLEVRPLPPRTNFLIHTSAPDFKGKSPSEGRNIFLLPRISAITVLSQSESEYAFLLPSILRSFACSITVSSLRNELFTSTPLYDIPNSLLLTAMTAPASGEQTNYQRLETLGDTVLKFVTGIQLLAEYPLWHEGYLSRKKDHAVANVRLARENIKKTLYRWIIRDRMLCRKWRPSYITSEVMTTKVETPMTVSNKRKNDDKKRKKEQLSTKVLADVVESLIGAAYLHGGFDLGCYCASFFNMGIEWQPLPKRIESLLARMEIEDEYPSQLTVVEHILGYTFERKTLLIEALTHASYQQNICTPSYERMEFLGDSVLDMIVTDFLYHAPGKNYSPGHIHLRKSAVVNAHILAYICLSSSTSADATMPGISSDGRIALLPETHDIFLWQCLLHSSPSILEDQRKTATRYKHRRDDIHKALTEGKIFPWADLIRLQAPKFFSDMVESLIGAVFLDSSGDIDVARAVMTNLGIFPILDRIVRDDVDVLHPVSRLSLWASKHDKELEYRYEKENGKVSCIVFVDEKEECRITETYHGRASQEEVKFMAAERAIKLFRLRDVDVNYSLLKKKRKMTVKKVINDATD